MAKSPLVVTSIRSEHVLLSDLVPNPWNPNQMNAEMYHKELASLRRFGYVNPIIARPIDDYYQIIDGEHRRKGLLELGHETAMVTVIDGLSDADAKQLTIILNETRGTPDQKKLGELLTDLLVTVPKTDLLDLLPINPTTFDKLTGLEDFDWSALDTQPEVKDASWVERTYRMPKDAALVLDAAIEKVQDESACPDWQAIERLAADYLAGD